MRRGLAQPRQVRKEAAVSDVIERRGVARLELWLFEGVGTEELECRAQPFISNFELDILQTVPTMHHSMSLNEKHQMLSGV